MRQPEHAVRIDALQARLVEGVRSEVCDVLVNGHPTRHLPGIAHLSFPGCEGDSLLMLLDARGIECSTGSACSAGIAQPSHVLIAMGATDASRPQFAAVLPRPHLDRGRCRCRRRGHRAGRRARPQGRPHGGARMKVLAAMSGGVDSAVAAARAVDAGHDVTGVHLALSQTPDALRTGSRGCCTIEDANDARRVADVLDIPFYIWDLADRFREDVVDDFVAEYAAGHTPNPCLRCNEKIKFAAVLDRAVALGFDAVATGHHARLIDGRLRRSVDEAKDQSYVLAVLTPQQLSRAIFPLGDSTKARVREEAAARGLAVAAKPDSHDICFIADGDTRGFLARRLGVAQGEIVDAETGSVLGEHQGSFGFTVGQRRGLNITRPAPDGEPRYVLSIQPATNRVVVGPGPPARGGRDPGVPPGVDARRAGGGLRLHRAAARARHGEPGDGDRRRHRSWSPASVRPQRGIAAGQALVMYDGDAVIGSATITSATARSTVDA